MPVVPHRPLLDDAAGLLIRPYTVSDGRTRPTAHFDHMTMVMAATPGPARGEVSPDHELVLRLCGRPVAVAEIAAYLKMPAVVVKVLLSDLVECGAVITRSIEPVPRSKSLDLDLLEAVLDGLRKRL
jgi:hypothetical protein